MSLTREERQEIIDAACEKALLMLPEVVGTLMAQHAALLDVNKKFYGEHPEFKDHKGLVQSVVEQVEGKHPNKPYEAILEDAVPLIRERMELIGGLDMETIKRTERRIPQLLDKIERDPSNPNGAL
jgi:hypothetical protein